jgi:GPH family glycoside/pentoside/hexuronide:cation symporter
MATALLIYAIWNAVNDPLFGYITDSTRSKLGYRIPYMRYTAPFLALTFTLIWFAPPEARDHAIFAWMVVTMLLYDTAYTMIGLVYSALLPEITEADAERNADCVVTIRFIGDETLMPWRSPQTPLCPSA